MVSPHHSADTSNVLVVHTRQLHVLRGEKAKKIVKCACTQHNAAACPHKACAWGGKKQAWINYSTNIEKK